MIAMSGMCMHCACHPGSGMFARLVWLLMRMFMGVSVIHGALILSRSGYLIYRLWRLWRL